MTVATSVGGWVSARKLCGAERLIACEVVLVPALWEWELWQRSGTLDSVQWPNSKVLVQESIRDSEVSMHSLG